LFIHSRAKVRLERRDRDVTVARRIHVVGGIGAADIGGGD
jgi:hypothetical protein